MILSREKAAQPSSGTRPLALFLTQQYQPDAGDAELFSLALEAGFRPFVVPWFSVTVQEGSTYVSGGYELLPEETKRPVVSWEMIVPRLILHRMEMSLPREQIFARLARANPQAVVSYHPELRFINSRWGAELCLRAGERKGLAPARPETFLLPDEISPKLHRTGERHPLVFKHFDSSQGRAVALSNPVAFRGALRELADGAAARFVVQRVVENEVALAGRRFELRAYAYVESFRPLSCTVYTDGFARVVPPLRKMKRGPTPLGVLLGGLSPNGDAPRAEHLTVAQMLEELRAAGLRVDGFEQKVEALAQRLCECFAEWEPLASDPQLHRLILFTGLDMMLVDGPEGVEPLFVASHDAPPLCARGDATIERSLHAVMRGWLARLAEKCQEPQTIILPLPEFDQRRPAVEDAVRRARHAAGEPVVLKEAASVLNHLDSRERLVEEIGSRLTEGETLALRADDAELRGLQLLISRHDRAPVLNIALEPDAEVRGLRPPLAAIFPRTGPDYCMVETEAWPGAEFEYLNPALVGPRFGSAATAREESLLRYLGRVITAEPNPDPLAQRFVEPGVGRTTIVDFLRVEGRPEFTDFSVLGVGLTPYSAGGYAMVGPYVDGKTSVNRAVHRHRCSERLEEAGCRVAKTLAIIRLPGLETTMPDETKAPAALIVRGFRSILRVKQLDPLASLFLSLKHRPQLLDFLLDSRWDIARHASGARHGDFDFWLALSRFGGTTSCMRRITDGQAEPAYNGYSMKRARERRLQVIYSYSPILLGVVKARLAGELGRDPDTEPLSDEEYLYWFARNLGAQLALMKRLRFLHDYHQEGISRYTPQWIYTLCETNVTLLAEFPDLDTGVFTDRLDPQTLEELLISTDEFRTLQEGYESFHAKDVREARAVLRTLALIVFHGDADRERWAAEQFTRGYEETLSRRSHAAGARGARGGKRPRARRQAAERVELEPDLQTT